MENTELRKANERLTKQLQAADELSHAAKTFIPLWDLIEAYDAARKDGEWWVRIEHYVMI